MHFARHAIPLPPFCETTSIQGIKDAAEQLGLPMMLKARRGAYDGRGNAVLSSVDDAAILACLDQLGCAHDDDPTSTTSTTTTLDLYAEGWIDFDCEIAVMVAKSATETAAYPAVQAIQQDSICRVVLAPARNLSQEVRAKCQALAMAAIDSLGKGASGMFGVELFLTKSGTILLNEVAPRPHNTGHYTQDACVTNQFEQHLRGICGLKLGSTAMLVEAAGSKCLFCSIFYYNNICCVLFWVDFTNTHERTN
jgi:phosphoribosylaminoimidazole carboxylase